MAADRLFEPLRAAALSAGRVRTAVAYPLCAASLGAAVQAQDAGYIEPLLVGPAARLAALMADMGLRAGSLEIIDTPDDERQAAAVAAALARDGKAGMLMKGSLHTDHFMSAVVARESGLRTGRRISHAFVMSVAAYAKLFILTDAAVNIAPTLAEKADIAQNAIDLARALGVARPKVAVLCATESVNPAMPATLDAAALSKMADRQQIRGGEIDGPLAFDNAISRLAAEQKGIVSPVAGDADILLVPDIEAGNMLYKELTWLAGAGTAGLVLGTRVPVLLTSRSDSVEARVNSCAVAVLHARALAG
ncbi:Phosphate acetyltransferase [Achromobacter deleyi]|uniref:Phosphate acetyltransferase n=1 Tax=Achromobacter deleyi TaxID=1353891 RepID=A0A6S7BZD7_9BURK|nr:bifunctional enoyl-CoA hydratase/phosphate acetyltransferase [Achromobacter deleyi]CAB3733797.1 Phosphate acetyltransferase [Achromobacter deleyi]CAB3908300.1 Phosphate acetyltransferase [Achromobacter deleyi]CAB3909848.1 Phosphate acetyltransferase [Achromobacter deleyi]